MNDPAAKPRSRIGRLWWLLVGQALPPILVLVVVGLLWQAAVRVFDLRPYLLPPPLDVLRAAIEHHDDLAQSLGNTAIAAGIGLAGSAVIGVLIAVLLSTSRIVQRAFWPYTIFFQTVPIIAIAPLLVIWLGFGRNSVAASAFIASVFPVIANTLGGLLATDTNHRDLFRLYRASRWATLVKLRLPAALPQLLTGLRIASGLAVIGAIVGEFVAGELTENAGLGITVLVAKRQGNTDVIIAAVLAASLLGLAAFSLVNLASWILLRRWHASEQ
jgi:NitT/TauT family transport system permease protein